jgi:hypothetical protein
VTLTLTAEPSAGSEPLNYFFEAKDWDTGVVALEAYVNSGESVEFYLWQGKYEIEVSRGAVWRGVKAEFGSHGEYSSNGEPFVLTEGARAAISLSETFAGTN